MMARHPLARTCFGFEYEQFGSSGTLNSSITLDFEFHQAEKSQFQACELRAVERIVLRRCTYPNTKHC